MSPRTIALGAAMAVMCFAAPAGAQEVRDPRTPAPATSFWSWSSVSNWGDISRLLLGGWTCTGAYADGPTLETCGSLTTSPLRRRRMPEVRTNETGD